MPATDHYALLLAINRYPGLSNLSGPENDALALRDWLLDPAGGALDPAHLVLIKSSDFADTADPYDANPTDTQVKKALNQWLKANGAWRDHVGQRLYLFFAGHGFTAGTLTDPVLFTAQAQLDDRAYIAAYRYASKIVNAGFFDEVVLLMDCCQDVLKAASISEPSWSPPDRMCSDKVKLMVALGAPRGRKAFEQSPAAAAATPGAPPPPVHGYFSSVFLDALRTAPADDQGYVTARSVEATFGALWTQRYLEATGYEPPFVAPRDMKLYRRAPAALAPASAPAAAPAAAPKRVAHAGLAAAVTALVRRPVQIAAADPGAQIRVFDVRNRIVGKALGALRLNLPDGHYKARVRLGGGAGAVSDLPMTLSAQHAGEPVLLPSQEFASPAPAQWSKSRHEFHQDAAAHWLGHASQVSAWPDSTATLLVFARDSAHSSGQAWRMNAALRQGLRLRRLMPGSGEVLPVDLHVVSDAGSAFTAFKIDLPAGTYLLGAKRRLRARWVWDEMPLTLAAPDWRTEVWLDCEDDEQDLRRFDLDSASVLVAPRDDTGWMDSPAARTTELLRGALTQRALAAQTGVSRLPAGFLIPPEAAGPMAALYAATALAQDAAPDTGPLRERLQWLAQEWSALSADVVVLQRRCEVLERGPGAAPLPALTLAPDAVPMLQDNWNWIRQGPLDVHLSRAVQQVVGLWRTAGDWWVQTQRPDVDNDLAAPTVGLRPALPRLPDGALDLGRIADSLGRPDPLQSPLHQTLRNLLRDARGAADPALLEGVVTSVAAAAALDTDVVLEALGDLWAGAQAGPRRQHHEANAPVPPVK